MSEIRINRAKALNVIDKLVTDPDATWNHLADIASFYLNGHLHEEEDDETVALANLIEEVVI